MIKTPESFLIDHKKSVKHAMRQMKAVARKELFVTGTDGKLFGSLSDGDIRKWILAGGGLDAMIADICNRTPRIVPPRYDLEEVKRILLEYRIEAVPVVDDSGFVIDVLVWREIFRDDAAKSSRREKVALPVVIMAGGKGSRLAPFTRILPKPLIPIGDRPIIQIIIDRFLEQGAGPFYISLHHKSRMIRSYFEEVRGDYKIRYIEEDEPLGTAGCLARLKGKIKGPFIVTNCDIMIDTDYADILRLHKENKNDLTMVVSMKHYLIPYGVCEISKGGNLLSIREKPEYDLLVNTGMYIIEPSVLPLIPANKPFDIDELIVKARSHGRKVGVFPVREQDWTDIGQWEEYKKALKEMAVDL